MLISQYWMYTAMLDGRFANETYKFAGLRGFFNIDL